MFLSNSVAFSEKLNFLPGLIFALYSKTTEYGLPIRDLFFKYPKYFCFIGQIGQTS